MADAEKPVIIYALSDPRKPQLIRYIGKTVKRLSARLAGHITYRTQRNTPKNAWISSLLNVGLKPLIWPMEICNNASWEERERYWIWLFRPIPNLLNLTDGGDTGPDMTGYRHSLETKAKIGAAGVGRLYKHTPETIERIKRTKKENAKPYRWKSEASRERSRSATIGRNKNPAIIEKIRLSNLNSEKRRASYEKMRGKKRPPEIVAKIRSAVVNSPKWRAVCTKPVFCVTTGQRFDSIKSAAKAFGFLPSSLSKSINNPIRTTLFGTKWRYA